MKVLKWAEIRTKQWVLRRLEYSLESAWMSGSSESSHASNKQSLATMLIHPGR
jgi:hypothetical protein